MKIYIVQNYKKLVLGGFIFNRVHNPPSNSSKKKVISSNLNTDLAYLKPIDLNYKFRKGVNLTIITTKQTKQAMKWQKHFVYLRC